MKYLYVLKLLAESFIAASIDNKILSISIFFLCISSLKHFLFFPIVFNFKIIPRIEQKIGRRLQFSPKYDYHFLFGSWFAKYLEISIHIFIKYLELPFKDNKERALIKVNYQCEEFSKQEIFWSLYAVLNIFVFFISLIILMIIYKYQS